VSDQVRVLIVDDQAVIRAGLRMIVDNEDDLDVVGEAGDGQTAIQMARALRPDVVLMDVRMPRMDGLEATRRIVPAARADGENAPRVLVLTTFDDEEYLLGALRAGASGFLLKDAGPDALVSAIRTVRTGDSLIDPAMTGTLISRCLDLEGRAEPALLAESTALWRARIENLSPREHDVLLGLARGSSNRDLARKMAVTEATVKTHVSSVLAKLGARSRLEAVVAAYESGLIEPGTSRPPGELS
jgi:DNA-binding NarL/FixJ family response regulator